MSDPLTLLPDDEHNRALVRNVHPGDWMNPIPASRYNLVVIGAGTAGLVSAAGAAGLGAKVALVERAFLGGDCLNFGCVPSKALLRSARAAADVGDAAQFGVEVPAGTRVSFASVMERLRRLRAGISPHDSAQRFRELGVDVFLGSARFTGPDAVQVGDAVLRFRKAVIATGARPATPDIPGLADAGFLTNETIFSLTELPTRLAVIGAGPIGCELAQGFARCGSQVTLIGRHPQLLPREDRDAAAIVEQALRRDGVRLLLGAEVKQARREGADRVLLVEAQGQREEVRADAILVGAGRRPNVEGMNLEAAGVAFDVHGVQVNDHLRTTNRRIYAAGDVCSRYQFTHAADAMARLVIQNALFWGWKKASVLTIPWCTYTDPEIAHVGLYEHEAQARGFRVQNFTQDLARVDRAVLDGETDGFVRVLVKQGSDRILGATIVARHAGDLIALFSFAMTNGLGLKALAATVFPYPTQAEAIKRVADAYQRTRLTPWLKRLFATWLRWTR
jgi:pyruvate/2-oxoglutarate dehydrogenase complex dihydrolipoamide dehydrogenase (E3) component